MGLAARRRARLLPGSSARIRRTTMPDSDNINLTAARGMLHGCLIGALLWAWTAAAVWWGWQ